MTFSALRKMLMPVIGKVWVIIRTDDPQKGKGYVEKIMQERIIKTRQALRGVHGAERIKTVKEQLETLFVEIVHTIIPYAAAGIIANALLKKISIRMFGDEMEVHRLNKSLPGNVTSEMGLELGDLADKARELPEVQEYLKTADDQHFYSGLEQVPGGRQFKADFEAFIDRYGMRCPGEIDITTPRWYETPTRLVSAILSNIRSLKPGEHRQRFAEGERSSLKLAV